MLSSLKYDQSSYQQSLYESVSPGLYQIAAPAPTCLGTCSPVDPQIRFQKTGVGACDVAHTVNQESELHNLNRPLSKCSTNQYLPQNMNALGFQGQPSCQATLFQNQNGQNQQNGQQQKGSRCGIQVEDSRLTNPPCTLRGTGWNRWETLCHQPQDKALMRFPTMAWNRQIVKDNHRPCLPRLRNQAPQQQPSGGYDVQPSGPAAYPCMERYTAQQIQHINWRSLEETQAM